MLIEKGTTANGTYWELRKGTDGSGDDIYVVQTERQGETRRITHQERLPTEGEAKAWIQYAI
jgi:hypothetical protein